MFIIPRGIPLLKGKFNPLDHAITQGFHVLPPPPNSLRTTRSVSWLQEVVHNSKLTIQTAFSAHCLYLLNALNVVLPCGKNQIKICQTEEEQCENNLHEFLRTLEKYECPHFKMFPKEKFLEGDNGAIKHAANCILWLQKNYENNGIVHDSNESIRTFSLFVNPKGEQLQNDRVNPFLIDSNELDLQDDQEIKEDHIFTNIFYLDGEKREQILKQRRSELGQELSEDESEIDSDDIIFESDDSDENWEQVDINKAKRITDKKQKENNNEQNNNKNKNKNKDSNRKNSGIISDESYLDPEELIEKLEKKNQDFSSSDPSEETNQLPNNQNVMSWASLTNNSESGDDLKKKTKDSQDLSNELSSLESELEISNRKKKTKNINKNKSKNKNKLNNQNNDNDINRNKNKASNKTKNNIKTKKSQTKPKTKSTKNKQKTFDERYFENAPHLNTLSDYLVAELSNIYSQKKTEEENGKMIPSDETIYLIFFLLNTLDEWNTNIRETSITFRNGELGEFYDGLSKDCVSDTINIGKLGEMTFPCELYQKKGENKNNEKVEIEINKKIIKVCTVDHSVRYFKSDLNTSLDISINVNGENYYMALSIGSNEKKTVENFDCIVKFSQENQLATCLSTILYFINNKGKKNVIGNNPPTPREVQDYSSRVYPILRAPNKKFEKLLSSVESVDMSSNPQNILNKYYQNNGVNFLITIITNNEFPLTPGYIEIRKKKLKVYKAKSLYQTIPFSGRPVTYKSEKNICLFRLQWERNRACRAATDTTITFLAKRSKERSLISRSISFFASNYRKHYEKK
ncbi:delta adaptin-related [Anaeramoeba flamelloides]|uniref:Delta adaptin-related n=1 Tax=Anaeramoeba flamelloides TaxID=1746091 RepID=A0AAV7ZT40_9EUKA|nr:delta adaptin-related [Anaeramoeba flamelloides]